MFEGGVERHKTSRTLNHTTERTTAAVDASGGSGGGGGSNSGVYDKKAARSLNNRAFDKDRKTSLEAYSIRKEHRDLER